VNGTASQHEFSSTDKAGDVGNDKNFSWVLMRGENVPSVLRLCSTGKAFLASPLILQMACAAIIRV